MIQKIFLGYFAIASLLIGVWAQFFPLGFYKNFPGFGHAWVSADGPYNEHLLRDVGGLNLGLGIVAALAMFRHNNSVAKAAALMGLIYGLPHFLYHFSHLALLSASDQIANTIALLLNILAPMVVLLAKQQEQF